MYPGLDAALERAGDQLDDIRTSLRRVAGEKSNSPVREQVTACAYVLLEAVLESSLKATLTALIDEINAASVQACNLRWSLFSLFANPAFESIAGKGKSNSLRQRVDLLEGLQSTEVCVLNNAYLPMDGRTIRRRHLDLVWAIFGFPGSCIAELRHQFTLETTADARNDIAHGGATPREVAGRQPLDTVLGYVDEIEMVILHIDSAARDYIATTGYVR